MADKNQLPGLIYTGLFDEVIRNFIMQIQTTFYRQKISNFFSSNRKACLRPTPLTTPEHEEEYSSNSPDNKINEVKMNRKLPRVKKKANPPRDI